MNFNFTKDKLSKILVGNKNVAEWYESLIEFLPEYEINNVERTAAFLAQCAHESSNFRILQENLNYRAEQLYKVFRKYFPTIEEAAKYERKPEIIANRIYANRMGNGDEKSGDGYRFRGRGIIQITGKENYSLFSKSIDMELDNAPSYLETINGAVHSACWFWNTRKLNQYADKLDIDTISRKINGGTIGLEDRKIRFTKTIEILKG